MKHLKAVSIAAGGFIAGLMLILLVFPLFAQAAPWIDLSGVSRAAELIVKKQKCLNIKAKINQRAQMADNFCRINKEKYASVSDKLDKMISKADDKGYNVDLLKADANAFNDKLSDFNQHCQSSAAAALGLAMATHQCDNPDGNNTGFDSLKDSIKSIRQNVQAMISHAKDTKKFYRETIKADIFTVSQQKYKED